MSPGVQVADALASRAADALRRASDWLLASDAKLESDGVPLPLPARGGVFTWLAALPGFDRLIKLWERHGSRRLRARGGRRGVEFLLRTQEQDGSWHGCDDAGYVHGTFLALRGLRAAGVDDREAAVLRAGEWLRSIQNADGGWGESRASHDKRAFTPASSAAAQTAWAVLGLIAGGDTSSLSVEQGVEYLLRTQTAAGTWDETHHLYRHSFPLLALTTFLKTRDSLGGAMR